MAKQKRGGRPQMTDAEKEARKVKLAAETKSDKFKRLGAPRMNKALNAVRQIGNLAGSGYEYEMSQIEKMRGVLDLALNETFARFTKGGSREKTAFTF